LRSQGSTNRRFLGSQILICVGGAVAAFADAARPLSPTNIFAPASTPAKSIFELSLFVLAVTGAIFLVVFTLLLYSVVKFRKRTNDDGREPPQVYGSNQVELAWTIIPILIVVALFMATARVIAVVVQALLAAIRMEEEMGSGVHAGKSDELAVGIGDGDNY
jgi:cytochrome c oxidase subunit II